MTAYDMLLRRLARAVRVLDSPSPRTRAAAEAAELLLQLDAKDFPTEELERQCRFAMRQIRAQFRV